MHGRTSGDEERLTITAIILPKNHTCFMGNPVEGERHSVLKTNTNVPILLLTTNVERDARPRKGGNNLRDSTIEPSQDKFGPDFDPFGQGGGIS